MGRQVALHPLHQFERLLTGRYSYARFSRAPLVPADYNPALHDHDAMLFGGGLYREKFYSANMVYGFGTREYLATGYKPSWSADTRGANSTTRCTRHDLPTGGFRWMGYVMGGFTLGSYIDLQTACGATVRRRRPEVVLEPFLFRRSRIRQFLAFNYTQGWNRGTGSDEIIRMTRINGLQALKEHVTGTNRMILNTETVFFTPYQPLGFRIALFGFADFGLIGYSPNIFKNDFFTSFGFGVRIKNERLIFNTIQIRLGLAFGKRGLVESEYVRVSNQTASNNTVTVRHGPKSWDSNKSADRTANKKTEVSDLRFFIALRRSAPCRRSSSPGRTVSLSP